jgi:hypothetical protein
MTVSAWQKLNGRRDLGHDFYTSFIQRSFTMK